MGGMNRVYKDGTMSPITYERYKRLIVNHEIGEETFVLFILALIISILSCIVGWIWKNKKVREDRTTEKEIETGFGNETKDPYSD